MGDHPARKRRKKKTRTPEQIRKLEQVLLEIERRVEFGEDDIELIVLLDHLILLETRRKKTAAAGNW